MRNVIGLMLVALLGFIARPVPVQSAEEPDLNLLLKAAAGGAGAVAALMGETAGQDLLAPEGCLIWQQPGVAIVPQVMWEPNRAIPEIYLDGNVVFRFLACLPAYSLDEPLVMPREEDYAEGAGPPPQVYLLGREAANRRLAEYYKGYETYAMYDSDDGTWPEGYRRVDAESLKVDCAAVFVDGWQSLSFFFELDEAGHPRLKHFIIHPFFSA